MARPARSHRPSRHQEAAGHQKGQDDAGAGDVDAHPGDDEDAGPDDLGDANDHQVQAGEAAA
jgi:hypothetical protein